MYIKKKHLSLIKSRNAYNIFLIFISYFDGKIAVLGSTRSLYISLHVLSDIIDITKNVVSMTMQRYNKLFDWPNIIWSNRYFPMIMMSCGALVFPPK